MSQNSQYLAGAKLIIKFVIAFGGITILLSSTAYSKKKPSFDLELLNISWTPEKPRPGDKVVFTATVRNNRDAVKAGTWVGVYLTFNGQGAEVWSGTSEGFRKGEIKQLVTFMESSWSATSGNFLIKGFADDQNKVAESNEQNNFVSRSLIVAASTATSSLYYPMDAGSGSSANEFFSGQQNATLSSGMRWVHSGVKGEALSFDGANYLTIGGSANADFSKGFTFSAHVFFEPRARHGMWPALAGNGDGSGFLIFREQATGLIYFKTSIAGNVKSIACFTLPERQWTHVGITYDGNTLTCYKNGNLVTSLGGLGGPIDRTSDNILIGARPLGQIGSFWQGVIDEVRVQNFAASKADLEAFGFDTTESSDKSLFGFNGQYQSSEHLQDAKKLGLVWDRVWMNWTAANWVKDKFDWNTLFEQPDGTKISNPLSNYRANKISIFASINGTPPWACARCEEGKVCNNCNWWENPSVSSDPRSAPAYKFTYALVKWLNSLYPDYKVQHFSGLNEMDYVAKNHIPEADHKKFYVDYVKAVLGPMSMAVHDACREMGIDCKFLGPALGTEDFVVHQILFDAGAYQYFDLIDLHSYRGIWSCDPSQVVGQMATERKWLLDHGIDKDVWISETGQTLCGVSCSDPLTAQSTWIRSVVDFAYASPWLKRVFLYNLRDQPGACSVQYNGFGLYDADWKLRPAGNTMLELSNYYRFRQK